ncbi:MAG: SdrD B-like domain-containing protein, partial [Pseudomonadota bacterium]
MFELTNIRRKTKRQRFISLALAGLLSFGQIVPAHAFISNTATVSGDFMGTTIDDSVTLDVDVVDAAPALLVTKTATLNDDDSSGTLSAGDTVDFEITLDNDGNVSIDNINLVDTFEQNGSTRTLTSGPAYVSGDITNSNVLDVDEVWTYQASYIIQQSDIDDGNDLDNTADFTGDSPGGPVAGQGSVSVSLAGYSEITLDKVATSTSFARPGDVVTWQLTATNTGGTTLTGLTVTDDTADTLVCTISGDATIATLAPGIGETCIATYAVQALDIGSDPLTNVASVSGTIGGVTVSDSATADIARENADLVTVKSIVAGGAGSMPGDTITYSIVVTNNGTADATDISLTDLLPTELTATANNGNATAGAYDDITGIWTIAALSSGANATLTLEGVVNPGQGGVLISNTVSAAQSAENDPTTVGDVLTALFTPLVFPIIAVDDTLGAPFDGAFPLVNVLNVFDGDTLNSLPANDTNVTVTEVGTWPTGFTLNSDGSIDAAGAIPTGTYEFDYQICEIADPDNCSVATVTIPVVSTIPRLAGTVFEDNNQNGSLDASDTPVPNFIVQLVQAGVVLNTTTTDSVGEYEFTGFVPGTYDVVFIDPDSDMGVGFIQSVIVGPNDNIIDQDLPIDPSGVVYNSLNGDPIAGATATLVGSNGNPLPAACLLQNQQNQVTGSDGEYR